MDLTLDPVVAVMGARQVGKIALCQEIARERGFAHRTLDDRDVREQALADPDGFLASLGTGGAFIDEASAHLASFARSKPLSTRISERDSTCLAGQTSRTWERLLETHYLVGLHTEHYVPLRSVSCASTISTQDGASFWRK